MNYKVADLSGFNRRFRKVVEGQPSLLIHDGQVIAEQMSKERGSKNELDRAVREHGVASPPEVALALLEISCLNYEESKPEANTHLARRRFIQKH